jgi:hypothetical protein
MKIILWFLLTTFFCARVCAQTQELQQLRLDLEKLAQFKLMLSEMKSGYQTLTNGYNTVKDIAKSNLSLHQKYLDGLLDVSPQVKSNPTIQRAHSNRQLITVSLKNLLARIRSSGVLTSDEVGEAIAKGAEIEEVVSGDAELLQAVLTPGKLRMSDAERSALISQVDTSIQKQLAKLKALSDECTKLVIARLQKKRDVNAIKRLANLH